MSSFPYTYEAYRALRGGVAYQTDDVRGRLVMSNTTCDTERNVQTFSGFTTIDVHDGAGYADVALTSEAVTADTVNFRAEFDAANLTFSSLANGTRQVAGLVLYRRVDGTDANDEPIAFIDVTDFNPGGIDLTFVWDAEGIIHGVPVSA